MVRQGFDIGARDWYVMCYYDVRTPSDLDEVFDALIATGSGERNASKAIDALSEPNSGYTLTDLDAHFSLVVASKATSAEELYDTIQHELKHVVEHISERYGISPRSEAAAYLQGEIARKMYPAVAFLVCPRCN